MEFVIVIVIIFVYFLPSIIASSREHHNSTALFFANLFFGWTFIGWVVCLIWALTNKSEDTTIINNNTNSEDASVADELEKLLKLKDAGILNEDEFRSQKEKILS
jgi:uncharacterized membrane protein|tara:strand:+ start:129 stop:443 length:315 start_codon:yes stop_codon:yes gene_type:complete